MSLDPSSNDAIDATASHSFFKLRWLSLKNLDFLIVLSIVHDKQINDKHLIGEGKERSDHSTFRGGLAEHFQFDQASYTSCKEHPLPYTIMSQTTL